MLNFFLSIFNMENDGVGSGNHSGQSEGILRGCDPGHQNVKNASGPETSNCSPFEVYASRELKHYGKLQWDISPKKTYWCLWKRDSILYCRERCSIQSLVP